MQAETTPATDVTPRTANQGVAVNNTRNILASLEGPSRLEPEDITNIFTAFDGNNNQPWVLGPINTPSTRHTLLHGWGLRSRYDAEPRRTNHNNRPAQ